MALPEYPMIDVEDYLILDKNSIHAHKEMFFYFEARYTNISVSVDLRRHP